MIMDVPFIARTQLFLAHFDTILHGTLGDH